MRSSLGIAAVFALAVVGALGLALAQRAYAPAADHGSIVSASSREVYVAKEVEGANRYVADLPLGEIQFLTVKSLVVDSDTQHNSTITPDGTSFRVSSGMQPGESYHVHVSLNNASEVHQSAELTVDAPRSMTIDVQASLGSSSTAEVTSTGPNRWTIVHPGETNTGGPFDLTISVYTSKFMSRDEGRVQFELKASEYVAQNPQLAGLVY